MPPSSSSTHSKSPPKGIQFWILLVFSLGVAALYLVEIYLSHRIINEQHFLVDQREIADTAGVYKEAWQKLAVESWKASQADPTMLDYLKSEGVNVHQGAPPAVEPATNSAPKPEAPPQPATP